MFKNSKSQLKKKDFCSVLSYPITPRRKILNIRDTFNGGSPLDLHKCTTNHMNKEKGKKKGFTEKKEWI